MKPYYISKVESAISYIEEHLIDSISTTDIAKKCNFSTFHFHRIFKSIIGESPYEYILRKRLERAAWMLKHGKRTVISEVGFSCGFTSLENFSRQFKQRFGVSPSKFKKDKKIQNSKIDQINKEEGFYLAYSKSRTLPQLEFEAQIIERRPTNIAVKRAVFGTDGSELIAAYLSLVEWGQKQDIPISKMKRYGMSIDDPEITPHPQYRYDFAIEIDFDLMVEGDIIPGNLPGGKYVCIHVDGDINAVAQAWDYLYQDWLPNSEYVPRDYPAVEEFLKGPEEIGWEAFNMNCLIPIIKT